MHDMCNIKTFGNLTYMPYGVELKNASENIDYKKRQNMENKSLLLEQ